MSFEIVEDVQTKTGRREEGLLATANTLVQKCVAAGGVLISGFIISFVGLDNPGTIESMQEPITKYVTILVFIAFTIPVISTFLLLFYNIDRKTHSANINELGYSE
jgi:Na+/melibiose symporter-like transporter